MELICQAWGGARLNVQMILQRALVFEIKELVQGLSTLHKVGLRTSVSYFLGPQVSPFAQC